jgi:hypothetical protein
MNHLLQPPTAMFKKIHAEIYTVVFNRMGNLSVPRGLRHLGFRGGMYS